MAQMTSNVSARTSATVTVTHGALLTFFNWENVLISPISVFVGIPASVVVICVMPYTPVRRKPKMFYILLAASGLGSQIFSVAFIYFAIALNFIDSSVVWRFEALGSLACKVGRFFGSWSDCLTGYLLILFTIERFVAVTYPFKVRLFTLSRSAVCSALIVVCGAAFNILSFFAYEPSPSNGINPYCSPRADAASLVSLQIVVDNTIPSFGLQALTVMTFVSLRRSRRELRTRMRSQYKRSAYEVKKEAKAIKAAVTMLGLSVTRCVAFVPQSILYIAWQLVSDVSLAYDLRCLAACFDVLTGMCGVLDFLVYVIQLPQFRLALLSLLRCKKPPRQNVDSGLSTTVT